MKKTPSHWASIFRYGQAVCVRTGRDITHKRVSLWIFGQPATEIPVTIHLPLIL